jgi:transcriptional antiterminator RfaH
MFDETDWVEAAVKRVGGGDPFRWFLAQLKPNCLAIATRNLGRQGFRSFVPMTLETLRTTNKFKSVSRPLFPGYVFVSLNTADAQWRAINSTVGVTKLVSFGGKPAAVPRGFVEQIALGCDAQGFLLPPEELAPGDSVLIKTGPFAGTLAEVERTDPNQRVWILLDLLGQRARLQVERNALNRR